MTCKDCQHWVPEGRRLDKFGRANVNEEDTEPVGQCHFQAFPAPGHVGSWRAWPVTLASESCGQFKLKVEEPKKLGRPKKVT